MVNLWDVTMFTPEIGSEIQILQYATDSASGLPGTRHSAAALRRFEIYRFILGH